MRLKRLLCLVLVLVAVYADAAPKPIWICMSAVGVPAAQDHTCDPDQRYVRGLNGAQPPSAPESRPATAIDNSQAATASLPLNRDSSALSPPPRAPSITLKPSSYLTDLVGIVMRDLLRLALALAMIFIIAAACKVFALRMGRSLAPSALSNAASVVSNTGGGRWAAKAAATMVSKSLRSANASGRTYVDDSPPVSPLPAKPTAWSLSVLRSLEWKRFEEVCAGFWRIKGYQARLTGPGSDGGVDVILPERSNPSMIFAVMQCKSWTWPVSVDKVRELWGVRDHFGAKLAVFYGLSGFTEDAKAFATGKHLVLIDGHALLNQLLSSPAEPRNALLEQVTRGDYTTPSCSRCEQKMIRRVGKPGRSDFWSCQTYKRCGTGPISIPKFRV